MLDRLSRKVEREGEVILLQPREFRLLEYLMKNAGNGGHPHHAARKMSGTIISIRRTNVIDVHMSRLRGKIDKGHANPLLHTIRGAGYMIP